MKWILAVAAAGLALAGCTAYPGANRLAGEDFATPVAAVVQYYEGQGVTLGPGTMVSEAAADLDGDGRGEALIYVQSQELCGTGGCPLALLGWGAGGWQVRQVVGPAQLPIYALDTRGGATVLGVTVFGGGERERIMALYPESGRYPANPTVDPATDWRDDPGEPLIDGGEGVGIAEAMTARR